MRMLAKALVDGKNPTPLGTWQNDVNSDGAGILSNSAAALGILPKQRRLSSAP